MVYHSCPHSIIEPVKVNQFLTRLMCKRCGIEVGRWVEQFEAIPRQLTDE